MSSYLDKTKIYNKYALDVVNGNITTCKNIKLACQRYLSWFDRDDIYFDYEDLDRKIRFTSRLRHSTDSAGSKAGEPFILLPWQQWIYAGIFAWKKTDTKTRLTDKVLCFVARKNGKSSLAAAIILTTLMCDNEQGAQCGIFANSAQQASLLFDMCSNYCYSIDPSSQIFKRYRSEIKTPHNNGKIIVKSSDLKTQDGANYHIFVLDEVHMQRTSKLYDVLRSSQQSRKQPLSIMITTAGTLLSGYFLYDTREYCINILNNVMKDDTYFIALYELDKDDDWRDEKVWIKANPSLGTTVIPEKLAIEVNSAKQNSVLEPGVRTKNFNCFVQSSTVWVEDEYLNKAMNVNIDLSKLKGEYCYAGADLAATNDFTAWCIMFPPNEDRDYYPDKFIFKNFVYIPRKAMENSVNKTFYEEWVRHKYATVTAMDVTDYDYVLRDMLRELDDFVVDSVHLDMHNASQFKVYADVEGLPMEQYAQGLYNFTGPTKSFEIYIKTDKIIIDKNPLVKWCFGNVEIKEDHNGNVKPVKAGNAPAKKIDPIIAMIEALGGYEHKTKATPMIYTL